MDDRPPRSGKIDAADRTFFRQIGQVDAAVVDRDRHAARSPRRSIAGFCTEQTAPWNLAPTKTFKGARHRGRTPGVTPAEYRRNAISFRMEFDFGKIALGNFRARRHGTAEDHPVRAPIGADPMSVNLLPGIQGRIGSTRIRVPEPRVHEAAAVRPPADCLKANSRDRSIDELACLEVEHIQRVVLAAVLAYREGHVSAVGRRHEKGDRPHLAVRRRRWSKGASHRAVGKPHVDGIDRIFRHPSKEDCRRRAGAGTGSLRW